MTDISHFTPEELALLRNQIDSLLRIQQAEKIETARQHILSIAGEIGMSVQAILGEQTMADKLASRPVQHPARPDLRWSRRGRRPNWIKEFLDRGNSIEDLRKPADQDSDVQHPA